MLILRSKTAATLTVTLSALTFSACAAHDDESAHADPVDVSEAVSNGASPLASGVHINAKPPLQSDELLPPQATNKGGPSGGVSPQLLGNCASRNASWITDTPWYGGSGGNLNYWQFHNWYCFDHYYYAARIRTNGIVVGIELAWYSPSGSDLLYRAGDGYDVVEVRGTDTGTLGPWEYCPANSVIVGVRGGSGGLVDRVGFACKNLQTGAISFLGEWGGAGGNPYSYGCDWWNSVIRIGNDHPGPARTGALMDGFKLACYRPIGSTVSWLQ